MLHRTQSLCHKALFECVFKSSLSGIRTWHSSQFTRQGSSIVVLAVEDPQDSEEQIDDIEVQADGRGDLLLNVIVPHDELGVHEDVAREDQGSHDTVDQLDGLSVWKESCHEAEDDQDPETAKEVGHPRRKVVFALAGERREEGKDGEGDDQGLYDDAALVKGRDNADAVCFQTSEAS